ncbi:hypothetical protein [Microbacterium aquimaris]|uniref:DUF2127 domain-containing protein n=1 Tax=Microbacterium aquimaris TaxID=459816 RepID=A0ABU5N562_9MICO|nr:hypothetical protein [Microbacterium aquimaris]MDZ8161221.1 hypothetical protein [Microbacterium aquimaris]
MNRPLGVTLVAIVAWLIGFFQIIGAIFGILGGLLITPSALLAWISLAVGIITLLVGVGLWRGNNTARTVATIVFVINIALEIIGIFNGEGLFAAIFGSVLPVIGLLLLYTDSASRYFRA